jgi:ABC-type transport system involved in multi-copper enzyme maturation, permease component
MSGLIRAEWIRFRKRRSIQIIVIAVPLLVAFFFVAGYSSIGQGPPPFDAEATRARLISDGYVTGLSPEEAEPLLVDAIASERANVEQMRAQTELVRSRYAFPESLVTVLGSSSFLFFALILLTATSLGDEFSWGTIRTTLLASSHRSRLLAVRLAAMAGIAVVLVASMLLVGLVLPAVLTGALPPSTPPFDAGALAVLALGDLEAGLVVIGFAAMATLLVRSGSLTLVVMLVYVVVEVAILALLLRFDVFKTNGAAEWVLNVLPVRGIATLTDTAARAAGGLGNYPGEEVVRDLGVAAVPLVALAVWAALFLAIAFRRFTRMDIVE